MTKPNVVSEAPPGVARNAGVEGVGRRRRTSKRRSRARERKCSATGPASATGKGVRGTCATSPGAIRRPEARCSLPSGQLACYCAQKLLPSGQPCLFLRQCKAGYQTDVRLKSGENLRTPRLPYGLSGHCARGLAWKARRFQGFCGNDEPTIKLMCDWKAEMNLRTPRLPIGITDIGPTDFHGLARKARKLQSCRSAFPGSLLQW